MSEFYYPAVKEPTGRVQFAKDRAEVVSIDRLGDIRRGQVVSIGPEDKPPTAKALDFARGLVASRNFSHVAVDTPLGVPVEAPTDTSLTPDETDLKSGFVAPEPVLDFNPDAPLNVDLDFNAQPPSAEFTLPPVSTKKSPK